MKTLQVHNYYRYRGGEDENFDSICTLLGARGHHVLRYTRDSRECVGRVARMGAFLQGIYSSVTVREVTRLLRHQRPDIVHIHNIYPFISWSVLRAAEIADVPVVLRCPNYRLVCPIGTHLHQGRICERCVGGHELACIRHNCRGDVLESTGYALRSMATRRLGLLEKRVACFVPPSTFVKQRLVDAGLPRERIHVLWNMTPLPPEAAGSLRRRDYIGFAGRIAAEKGIATLLEAARRTGLPIRVAGEVAGSEPLIAGAPSNVAFLGHLPRGELMRFYRQARFLVVPSVWFEPFGLAIVEAMSQGLAVIASRIGGIPEIVDDTVTGLLFEPGDAADLAEKMVRLWSNPGLCERMGQAALQRVQVEHGETSYYRRLMDIYRMAAAFRVR